MNTTIKLILNALIKVAGLFQISWACNLAVATVGPGQSPMNVIPALEYAAVGVVFCIFSSHIVQFIYSKDICL